MRRAALVAALFVVCAPVGAARGQTIPLPPLPPLPPEASTVLEYVAPTVSPVCGNAGFVVLIAQGTAATLPTLVDLATVVGPVFVVCGAVPAPDNPLTCAPDDQAQAVLDHAFAAAIGSQSLLSGRLFGPVVEQVVVVQDALPPPLTTAGLGALVVGTLDCRTRAPDTQPPPVDIAGDADVAPPEDSLFDDAGVFDSGSAPLDDLAAAGPDILTPATGVGAATPVVALIGGRDVSPLVYLLPLLLLALGVLVGRGLLAELR